MTLIFLFLFIVLLILIVKSALGKPGKILRFLIHVMGGVVGLWVMNLLLSVFSMELPINAFTITLVALLGFPGVIALVVFQVLGV